MGLLPMAVGLGLTTSLLMSEAFALASGGLVVPGYVALLFDRPYELALLFAAATLTYVATNAIGSVAIVYGKRRTTLTLLIGYLAHLSVRYLALDALPEEAAEALRGSEAFGLIVPGLLALWWSRQGLLETAAALCCASVLTRLGLIVIVGDKLAP